MTEQDVTALDSIAEQTALTCPECHGALWRVVDEKQLRFRCHTGHGFTGKTLAEHQETQVEAVLWSAVRALKEAAALAETLASRAEAMGLERGARAYLDRSRESAERAEALSLMLVQTRPED